MEDDHPHSDNPVRIGLVGLGGHGATIQQAVAAVASLEVVAVYDVVDTLARTAAERFDCEAARSYEAMLRQDDLEAVVLVTPNGLHRVQTEAAIDAGLHVFVEKPIANTVADGLAMVEAAASANRVLMVGHNMRFGRAARHTHELLDTGHLGDVVSVEIHFSTDNTHRLSGDAWRLQPDQCPLLPMMQLGIHAIDLVHYFLGAITEVHAFARSVTTTPPVIDSVTASFRVESGVLGTLVSNYCTQVAFDYRLAGTQATVHGTPHRLRFRRNRDTDGHGDGPATTHDYIAHHDESYTRQMNAFANTVRQGQIPETDGWTGLQALAVVETLQRSVETGAPQRVPVFGRDDLQIER